MIKKIVFIGLAVCFITKIQAQNFRLNDQVINVGLGLGSYNYSSSYYHLGIPPITVSFEKGIRDRVFDNGVLAVGGIAGFSTYTYKYASFSSRLTSILVGGRGILHYPIIEDNKIDTYGGLMMGIRYSTFDSNNSILPTSGANLGWSFFIGGRYYFSDELAGMMELGYGMTYLNIGLALKL